MDTEVKYMINYVSRLVRRDRDHLVILKFDNYASKFVSLFLTLRLMSLGVAGF